MHPATESQAVPKPPIAERLPGERRRHQRIPVAQRIRVRPAGAFGPRFEDVQETTNVSLGGLLFISDQPVYGLGMKLVITWPFDSAGGQGNQDYVGKVVRVEEFEPGRFKVAVCLFIRLSPAK